MNCPVCGKEMEQGKLLACGSRGLYFLPPDGDADALILTKKYITGQNGIVLDGWHYSTGFAFSVGYFTLQEDFDALSEALDAIEDNL